MEHDTPIPAPWEGIRVLRMLRPELPAQTIRVHPLQSGGDAALVSTDEPGDSDGGCALQCAGGAPAATAADRRAALTLRVPGVALVRPQGRDLRLGTHRFRFARVGLFRLEGGKAEGQGVVHAQAAHIFARGRVGADAALVDSRWPAAGGIPVDDWEVSWRAFPSGLGCGSRGRGAALHERGIARLLAGPRQGAKRGQSESAFAGSDDDRRGLGSHLLSAFRFSRLDRIRILYCWI